MFNLTEEENQLECFIPSHMLGSDQILAIEDKNNTAAAWTSEGVRIKAKLKPMSPHIVYIGDDETEKSCNTTNTK
jgi:hypothetical protein